MGIKAPWVLTGLLLIAPPSGFGQSPSPPAEGERPAETPPSPPEGGAEAGEPEGIAGADAAGEYGEEEEVYRLPETGVTANRDRPEEITREEMDREGSRDLWEAVRSVPGVILSGGGRRGDSNFTVRGFGADSVPVFIDGILMANPYRGEGDAARFLTGDLESVEIQKGFSSSLLGANTLGGAVLMRTAKPKEPLELMLRSGVNFDRDLGYADSTTVAAAGTKLKYGYGRGVFQFRDINHFRLSSAFEPASENPQGTGDRLYSDSRDLKISLMGGLTPIPALDIWLSWTYQNADKGVSPPDIRVREISPDFVLWDWPVWKRQSAALNAAFTQEPISLSFLAYFDKYDNRLDEYRDRLHYDLGIHLPHSDYDEYSLGGRLAGTWRINSWNEASGALTYKKENHRGLKGGYAGFPGEDAMTEILRINEDTWSFGAEWTANPWQPLAFKGGFGFNGLVPIEYWGEENEFLQWINAGYYTVQSRTMFLYTWQAGLFYTLTPDQEFRFTYARKNHFPAMAQRYSTRFGRNLPNPGLGPEIANHFELGYRGAFFQQFSLNGALYYSLMTGKIVEVAVPDPSYPSYQLNYARNLDSTSFYGLEAAGEWFPNKYFSAAVSFSVNQYALNHREDREVQAIPYYPEFTLNASAQIKPIPEPLGEGALIRSLSLLPRLEYISRRWVNTAGTAELAGYALVHLKGTLEITTYCALSLGIENLLDTYYEIRYNSPLAGRSYQLMVSLRY
ncbi:MAG: TonB-dependent receptor [Treponema sp.]|jgi:iron complex outermembrane receptor protein|nr:TonB-dependent receptor [Treponema sp.]